MLRKHQRSACNEDSYLAILHLSRVELHCKLQEKLHRVTWPLVLGVKLTLKVLFYHQLIQLLEICSVINLTEVNG
jgi:hypothetical protein